VKSGFARICSVVLLAGCGSTYSSPSSPTAPTATVTTSPACFPVTTGCLPLAPPAASRGLTGVVADAAGRPVAGASVAVQEVGLYGDFIVQSSASTNGAGTYSIPNVQAFNRGIGWLLVGASKQGYFADFKWWLKLPG
jgi:Carboxypeptidase regulatory-like domain